jgi:hypothetical protein
MIVIGFDAGNSETSVAVRVGSRVHHLTFPSVIGSGDYAELLRVRSGAGRAASLDKVMMPGSGASAIRAARCRGARQKI